MSERGDLVVRDPEILSGAPVIHGTWIPVYDVVASVEAGISIERILLAYSDLTARDVELACRWATANPPVESPKKTIGDADPAMVAAKRVPRRGRAG